jgi:hypothetical protein
VLYRDPRPRIVYSTGQQNPDSGVVTLDYGPGFGFFQIQHAAVETVTIHKQ